MSLKFFKVVALPGVLEANAMYFQYDAADAAAGLVIHMTDSAGLVARTVYGKSDATADIAAAIAAYDAAGATKLAAEIELAFTGDATGSASTDGSGDVSVALTLADVGTAGSFSVVTTDSKGRVTAGRALVDTDLPASITSNTSGNAATATLADEADKVTNALTINGTAFDGSAAQDFNLITAAEKGAAGGVATLDENGFIPNSQLPGAVDEIIEVADYNALPAVGEAGKLYVTVNEVDGKTAVYRWGGTVYVKVSDVASSADVADTLATARAIALSGDATGTVNFDGSTNVEIVTTLADVGTAGEQGPVVTTDAKGRVVSSRALELADMPAGITATTVDFAEAPAW